MKLAIVIVSTLFGMAAALPSPQSDSPDALEARRSRKKEETYTGAEIVSVLAARQNRTLTTREPQRGGPAGPGGRPGGPQPPPPPEDPELCYADCILGGGGDWQCICDCVDCGGASSR